jgi:hypothetical protein
MMEVKYFGVNEELAKKYPWDKTEFDPTTLGQYPQTREVFEVRENSQDLGIITYQTHEGYFISAINDQNKRAEHVRRAVAIAAGGQTATGEHLSMLATVVGYALFHDKEHRFDQEYGKALAELTSQTEKSSRFAVIAGCDDIDEGQYHRYMVETLALIHQKLLEVPTNTLPYKYAGGDTHLYLENGHRIYVIESNFQANAEPTQLPACLKTI